MRVASAVSRRSLKLAIGFALIGWLWLLMSFVAFVPFDRDSPALTIVSTTLVLFALSVTVLVRMRRVDWETAAYAALGLVLLVGLYSRPLRDDLPADAIAIVERHSEMHEDRYAFARELFWDTSGRFTGPTREYLLQPQRIFLFRSATYYWQTAGYVPSHLLAQLYRHMLVVSGRFQPEEVVYRTGRCFNSPHGYVEISHPDRELMADLWAAQQFDEYQFGQVVDMPSCDGITAEAEPTGDSLEPRSDSQERSTRLLNDRMAGIQAMVPGRPSPN